MAPHTLQQRLTTAHKAEPDDLLRYLLVERIYERYTQADAAAVCS